MRMLQQLPDVFMASRKQKSSVNPIHWFQRLKQRLTGRAACFIWGAIFGNAVLVQTVGPWDVLTTPPEQLLSTPWRQTLDAARQQVRQWGEGLTHEAAHLIKQRVGEWALAPQSSSGAVVAPIAPPATASGSEAFAPCIDQFPQGRALQPATLGAEWAARALCSDGFAVLYSGRTKTPLVTVERLNRSRLQQAAGMERTDRFYADARVPSAQRAELSDYQGSGYDRGHLAAAANQYTPTGMAQSFALTNMVPQDPTHNRKVWSKLEGDVRKYAQRAAGDVFVYTGTLYAQHPARTVGSSQVWVPDQLFKLVYDASSQRAWAYVIPNHAQAQIGKPIDYAQFVALTQWHLLAGLPVVGGVH